MTAVPVSRTDPPATVPPPLLVPDSFAKDAILAWFRGEFAAANAIIDALCGHLTRIATASSDYEATFAAIHHRRSNWIPIIQMQKYHSIAEVALELNRVVDRKTEAAGARKSESSFDKEQKLEKENVETGGNEGDDAAPEYDSPDSEITDSALALRLVGASGAGANTTMLAGESPKDVCNDASYSRLNDQPVALWLSLLTSRECSIFWYRTTCGFGFEWLGSS